MSYDCLGDNKYQFKLVVYKDCDCVDCVPFDAPAYLTIYNDFQFVVGEKPLEMFYIDSVRIEPNVDGLCLETVPFVCVERAEYVSDTVELDITSSSFYVAYQRCCRNSTILNIFDPLENGATYWLTIPYNPDATFCNSSPEFNNYPPIIICADTPLKFDHSAFDEDGDSLVYNLCWPYIGASPDNSQPQIAPFPPYENVNWKPGYAIDNQMGYTAGADSLKVHWETGQLTVTPPYIGNFVVGICVDEYRNGEFLTTSLRDFQFRVADCEVVLADAGVDADVYLCEGESYTLGGYAYGGDFTWAPTDGLSDPSILDPQITPSGDISYVLYVEAGSGCNDADTVNIHVVPPVTAEAGPPATICPGSSTTLNGSGGDTYLWAPGDLLNDPFIANPTTFGLTQTTTFYLTVQDKYGACASLDSVTVFVSNDLVANAGNDKSICPNTETQLDGSATGGVEPYTVEWSPIDGLDNPNSFTPIASPAVTTTYTLTVTSSDACIATDEITVTVSNELVVSGGEGGTICQGESFQLHVSPADAATYAWSDASIEQSANPSVSPSQTTTYTVTVTDANGCFGSASVTVEVIPVSDPGTMPDAQFVCDGASLSIASVNPVIAEGQGLTYVMHTASGNSLGTVLAINPDGNFDITSAPGLQVNTIYYISAVAGPLNTNGNVDFGSPCTRVAPGTPVVFLLPIKLTVKDYCDNVSTLFTLQVSVSGGLPAYDPANEVYNITGEYMGALQYNENVTLGPFDNAITYVLTATDAAGCLGVDSRFVECLKGPAGIELAAFYAQIQPNSTELIWQTATQTNSQYFVIESSTDGFTYTEVCTEPAAGNSNIIQDYQCSHLNPASGLTYYRLTEIDANNQKTIQGVISVMRSKAIQNSLAISQVSTDANQQNLTLYLQKPNTNTLANIQILSTQGQVVQTGQTHHAVWQTDIAHLPSGLYLLIAQVNDEMISKKIVINR